MSKFVRMTSLAATVAALTLTATPALAASASAATASPQAKATARIMKPLTLVQKQDLDLGTIALGQGTFTTTVKIASDGTFTCDTTKVTCSGTPQVAKYEVTGTANKVVTITANNFNLSNGTTNLLFTVDNPGTANLGAPGDVIFPLGGSIDVSNTTPDGVYTGNFDVSVDYQ